MWTNDKFKKKKFKIFELHFKIYLLFLLPFSPFFKIFLNIFILTFYKIILKFYI